MRIVSSAAAAASALARLDWAHRTLALGWWLFIATFFIAPDKHALRITFYALVALPAVIWSRLLIREMNWRDPLWLSIFATLLFLSLSALWGADAADSHALRAIKIMAMLFICFLVPRFLVRAGLLSFRHLVGAILVLATLVAVGNMIGNVILVLAGEERFNQYVRLAGFGQLDNPLLYGGIVGGSALLALCEFLRETRRSRQVLLLLVLAVLALALVLTMSRGPILYFLVVSAMIAAVYRAHWRRTLLLVLLASAAALPVALHPLGQAAIEANVSRTTYRPVIWATVMAEMPGKELFGQGWRDDQSVYTPAGRFGHPHNFLLAIYRFSGLVGLALFIAMTGLLFYGCTRRGRDIALPLGAWLLYGILLHSTNGRFPVSAPGGDWFFYWLPAALVFGFARPVGARQADGSAVNPGRFAPLPVDFSGRQVFALGSAPDSFPPPEGSGPWLAATVNGSQAVLERLGMPAIPVMTLMNRSVLKSSIVSGVAARKVLRGLSTDHLVVMSHKVSSRHRLLIVLRLWWLGYRYRSLTVLDVRERSHVMEKLLGDGYDASKPPSNGIFLALLVLHLGASRILMSGFSLSQAGHVYNKLDLPRRHLDGDALALRRIVASGLPVYTNDERFSRESGLPLISQAA
jgi:O-antigen ligase